MKNKGAGKFVPHSYKENNEWGISHVKEYLRHKGYLISDKDEDYGIDIKAEKGGGFELFEVEVKSNYPWTSKEDFPFPTLSFLARKKKWENPGFWYVIICKETEAMVWCHSNTIFKEEYKEIRNINTSDRKGKDVFYRVPIDKCHWLKYK